MNNNSSDSEPKRESKSVNKICDYMYIYNRAGEGMTTYNVVIRNRLKMGAIYVYCMYTLKTTPSVSWPQPFS